MSYYPTSPASMLYSTQGKVIWMHKINVTSQLVGKYPEIEVFAGAKRSQTPQFRAFWIATFLIAKGCGTNAPHP
jgi:hypothetical protein